ncbi:MAG: acid phosphatase, partial [Verrucomicrobia bacterium]|nr:acid phosphatase [Verrucomicrobiota bacterium]
MTNESIAALWLLSVAAFCLPAVAQPATQPQCALTTEDVRAAGAGCERQWIDANLAINEVQVVGTAESYKLAPSGPLISLIRMGSEDDVKALDYSQQLLVQQLNAGARSLDFDIAFDPKGGLYKFPAGASMAGDLVSDDYIAAMSSPGFKVIHILDIDFNSSCTTLAVCLQQ